ncbi:SDR family NAD(P)-dependent oxidoreductase [Marinoscillum pacificum]|uniref:SDR family NAD(P)-dependent oxidoreductase n=1 Tax=Marinoscillum pacificum TaxID=392723 RepID=UPI0021588C4A|nr:SDR family NAD(P)-dependent oxidoreductase [Marinoscillum pacificum]
MYKRLKLDQFGPWALVTGASSGLGKEFAHQLAQQGFNLVLVARRQALLQKLSQTLIEKYGIETLVIKVDLSDPNEVDHLIHSTKHLEVGLLVSNAGSGHPGEFIHKQEDDLLKMINTSVIAHLKLVHHFSPHMARKRKGGILLVSAMGASHGLPFMSNDAGTRGYINSLGLGLHEELKRYGVYLTVMITSPTKTPIVSHLGFNENKMPAPPLSTAQAVTETLTALRKNKSTIIPGRLYRIMNAIVPSSISRRMFGKMLAEGNNIKYHNPEYEMING